MTGQLDPARHAGVVLAKATCQGGDVAQPACDRQAEVLYKYLAQGRVSGRRPTPVPASLLIPTTPLRPCVTGVKVSSPIFFMLFTWHCFTLWSATLGLQKLVCECNGYLGNVPKGREGRLTTTNRGE